MQNPLLAKDELPPFEHIHPHHAGPAIESLIATSRQKINQLIVDKKKNTLIAEEARTNNTPINFDSIIYPLEIIRNELKIAWGLVVHLNTVIGSAEWRETYNALLPKITAFDLELYQDQDLYEFLQEISLSDPSVKKEFQKKKLVEDYLRDFKLNGIMLNVEEKEKLKKCRAEIAQLESQFSQNIIESTDHWSKLITEAQQLKGIPLPILTLMHNKAKEKGQEGWLVTMDFAIYDAIMRYAENEALREEIYQAYFTLASMPAMDATFKTPSTTSWDNGPVMVKLLEKRQQLAHILGFSNYADYALATRMVKAPKDVTSFLQQLVEAFRVKALDEIESLKSLAFQQFQKKELNAWDLAYYSERAREETFGFSDEETRVLFPENEVLAGLFSILHELYGITIKEITSFEKWHDSVRLYAVFDENNSLCAQFYIDLYERPRKRKGAWYAEYKTRIRNPNGKIQIPIAYVVANFRDKKSGDPEPLLNHTEIVTLFHEFGHCLHHILSKMDYPSLSGGNGVYWDAIEVPSQLMENWCFEKDALKRLSKAKDFAKDVTKDLTVESLIDKLILRRNYLVGIALVRQLEFSLFDFELHMNPEIRNESEIQELLYKIRNKTSIVNIPSYNRFQNTFAHIFAGPYAAGYYSYLWSEVMSTDIYEAFQEKGELYDKNVAEKFRTHILEMGGARDFQDLFRNFRGRDPELGAFLRQHDIV